jgi:hypothetical protein
MACDGAVSLEALLKPFNLTKLMMGAFETND